MKNKVGPPSGSKNALKSGRSKQITARITPEVHEYLASGETSAADKIERLVMAAIEKVKGDL